MQEAVGGFQLNQQYCSDYFSQISLKGLPFCPIQGKQMAVKGTVSQDSSSLLYDVDQSHMGFDAMHRQKLFCFRFLRDGENKCWTIFPLRHQARKHHYFLKLLISKQEVSPRAFFTSTVMYKSKFAIAQKLFFN